MRHAYANRATFILATMLVVAVLLFGWLRSRAIVIETEDDARGPSGAGGAIAAVHEPAALAARAGADASVDGRRAPAQPAGAASRSMSSE